MRRFLRKVLPSHIKAYDVKFRALPVKNGVSAHQNEKPELHKDFNKHALRLWLPKQALKGGLIVSPNQGLPFQFFGTSVDVGDAWVFHSDIYHGPSPLEEPEDRGYFATVSFCLRSEGSCMDEDPEETEETGLVPALLVA